MSSATLAPPAGVRAAPLLLAQRLPLVVTSERPGRCLADYAATEAAHIEAVLTEHGGILFRGFAVDRPETFAAFGDAVSSSRLDYVYRSTPRTPVAAGVFTTTEYPRHQTIPLHSENAYQRTWPEKLAFWCRVPAATGGETPIADLRAVTAAIPPAVLAEFAERGVRYVRHYQPNVDLPWQTVFQTEDPRAVEAFCAANGLECTWLSKDVLRTVQTCQGVARHPRTGETVFFNQAHLFHTSALAPDVATALTSHFADTLPRNATFGDGGEIPRDCLEAVRRAFKRNEVAFPWRADDVLLLDNMQTAHGRRPFTGDRVVLALLLQPHHS